MLAHASGPNGAPPHWQAPLAYQVRVLLPQAHRLRLALLRLLLLYSLSKASKAEHAASLLTSTVSATTSRRLWALLSSYVVVVECSKLNNAR